MKLDVAKKATSFFLQQPHKKNFRIKFFGGEPLINFRLIKELVTYLDKKTTSPSISYSITTNGTYLSSSMIDFLRDSNVELMLSASAMVPTIFKKRRIWDKVLALPNIGINLIATPNNVQNFSNQFFNFAEMGFKKFNLLPAYFNKWKRQEIEIFKFELKIIRELILKLKSVKKPVTIKNLDTLSPTPLFNNGFVVDCNGDIFLNNLFLSKHFIHLRKEIIAGNVFQPNRTISPLGKNKINFEKMIWENLPIELQNTNELLDNALSHFVLTLTRTCKELI